MDANYTDSEAAVMAAQMELLVLRASLPRSTTVRQDVVVIAPGVDRMTNNLAAQILARMDKPVLCAATANVSGILSVECRTLSGDVALQHALDVRAWDGEWDKDGGIRRHIPREGTPLLVYGRDESVLLSRTAFERWYRDYETSNTVGFTFRPPTEEERAKGAHYTMIADWIERDPSKLPFRIDSFRH